MGVAPFAKEAGHFLGAFVGRLAARVGLTVTLADDGPGFAPEVLGRLGEPYVTSRGSSRPSAEPESGGLGLGFFIAKTLIERSGGTLSCSNRPPPQSGAVVKVRWARADFEKQADITDI